MRDLSVITNQKTANSILESWFIQSVILQDMPLGLEWEADGLANGVVVHLVCGTPDIALVRALAARGNRVVLCHMGDETGASYDRDCYLACDLVLRNYYEPRIFSDPDVAAKTMWVPNGFKSGVGPRRPETLRRASRRRVLAGFLGWLDNKDAVGNERALFRDMAQRHPGDILLQSTSYFGRGYNVGLYSALMEYAVFAPCPAGNAAETIRLYDALELGCIPVCLRHPFLVDAAALGVPPFPVLGAWDEFPDLLARQRAPNGGGLAAIDALQAACLDWWSGVKTRISVTIAARLLALRRD